MPVRSLPHIPRSTKGPVGVRHVGKPFRTEVLSRPYSNDLTLGVAGTAISPANSAGQAANQYDDALDVFGGGLNYDTTHLHPSSAMAALLAMANGQTASQNIRYTNLRVVPNTQMVTRTYFWIDAAPTQNIQIIRYEDSAGTAIGGVRLSSAGALVGWRAANGILGTASAAIPTGQWIRLEIAIRAQTNTVVNTSYLEIRAWWTDPESTGTPDYSNVQNPPANGLGGNEVIDRVMFGSGNSVTALTAAWNIWFAQPATNYTDWVGPALVSAGGVTISVPVAIATATALAPVVDERSLPAAAAAAASALVPVIDVRVLPAVAAAAASGLAPSVLEQLVPGVAGSTASALGPTLALTVPPGVAGASASAATPGAFLNVQPATAQAVASALVPAIRLVLLPGSGSASASGLPPTLATGFFVLPATASAAASGLAPTVAVTVPPGAANAAASALQPVIRTMLAPAVAQATAAGLNPALVVVVGPPAAVANASALLPQIKAAIAPVTAAAAASGLIPVVQVRILPAPAGAQASGLIPAIVVSSVTFTWPPVGTRFGAAGASGLDTAAGASQRHAAAGSGGVTNADGSTGRTQTT